MAAIREIAPGSITAAELLRLSREGYRHELIRGVLREMPLAGARHGGEGDRLASRASVYVDDNDLGQCVLAETGFLLERDPDTVRGPDWAFVSAARLPETLPDGYLELAPDLVLEVRSPSATHPEVMEKIALWLRSGVKIVWDLDPGSCRLTVHRPGETPRVLEAGDTLSCEGVLPGFSLPLQRVFR